MFLYDLIAAVVVALLVGGVFIACRRSGPWPGIGWFFLVLILFAWVGGVWVVPFGPAFWGIHWLPFLWFGIVMALLVAASTPPARRPSDRSKTEAENEELEEAASVVVGTFFWLLVLGLVASLVLRYVV